MLGEAVWDEGRSTRCRSVAAQKGFFYAADLVLGDRPSEDFKAFKQAWRDRSATLSFHLDRQISLIVVEPLLFAAQALWERQALWPALEELKQAVAIAPRSSRGRLSYAEALTGLDRNQEAFRQRHLAYQNDPQDPQVLRRYGLNLFRIRSYRKAIPILKRAMRSLPDDEAILGDLAGSLMAIGQPEEGIRLYEKALKMNPENEFIRFNLGYLYYEKGDYSKAADYAASCIKKGHRTDKSLFLMARIDARLGNDEQALQDLEKAIKLDPTGQIAAAARQDEAFERLRGTPRFEGLTASARRPPRPSQPRPGK